jgi:hypothetical protein
MLCVAWFEKTKEPKNTKRAINLYIQFCLAGVKTKVVLKFECQKFVIRIMNEGA